MSAARSPRAARALARLRVGQWLGLTIGVLLAFAVTGIGLALIANHRLSDQRRVVLYQVEPALLAALSLENSLIDEETGVRGYIITAEPRFLEPYEKGRAAEARAYVALEEAERLAPPRLTVDVRSVRLRAQRWQRSFVARALTRTRRSRSGSLSASAAGKSDFDAIRVSLARLQANLRATLARARAQLSDDAAFLQAMLLLAGGLILGSVLAAGLLLSRFISRPLVGLAREAEQVSAGDFAKAVSVAPGPREIVLLGEEIDAMRRRIVHELTTVESARGELQAQALELTRSNAELEQFAYVASHDLQEPLRKVASFCQALERRYHGRLDERADQYIEFAVDGAKRMQVLINDLLAFSRVGRSGREHAPVELEEVLDEVRLSLARELAETGARIDADALPRVSGERTLLHSLLQNLIANALKFRGAQAPAIRLGVRREEDRWLFSCADNGIGIEREYAERIFVIFQRLHTKEAYAGTGIGLAMCRKIVEYHGGRMWLEPDHSPGAEFRFTLPIADDEEKT